MSQQAHESNLWKEIDAFLSRLPDAPRAPLPVRDPRRMPPVPQTTVTKADQKRAQRMAEMVKKLNLPANPSPADMQRLMQSPEYQEMLRFADDAQNTPEAKAADEHAQAKQRYDAMTKAWLQKSGYSAIRGWRGKAVALIESLDPQAVSVQFTTAKRFFADGCGRLCWSGGCILTAAKNGYPQRSSERKDPATVQLFIGQEGYFLKYAGAGLGANRDKLYQPFVTSNLFKMHRTADFPNMMGEPGDDGIFGFPFAGSGKALRGKMRLILEDNAVYFIGWELTPA